MFFKRELCWNKKHVKNLKLWKLKFYCIFYRPDMSNSSYLWDYWKTIRWLSLTDWLIDWLTDWLTDWILQIKTLLELKHSQVFWKNVLWKYQCLVDLLPNQSGTNRFFVFRVIEESKHLGKSEESSKYKELYNWKFRLNE